MTNLILHKEMSTQCRRAQDQSDPVSVLYTALKVSLSSQCTGKSTQRHRQGLKGDK